jgi:hypothetical protein
MAGALGGCVDGFRGSNLQLDLPLALPIQGRQYGPVVAGDLPANTHYAIYAIQQGPMQDRLFELARFELHRAVDLFSPCFIDVGDHVPYPGLPVVAFAARIKADTGIDPANPPPTATDEQKILVTTAPRRLALVGTVLGNDATPFHAVTSASVATYPAIAATCTGPADQFPAPNCIDDASNQRRLALCQATWKANPDLFEGTDRVLTAPLNGATRGFADVPVSTGLPPVGGAQFFVPQALDNIDAFAIYSQTDGVDGPGTQVMFGTPIKPAPTRGVIHVHLVSGANPMLRAELAVFADLGQDGVQF